MTPKKRLRNPINSYAVGLDFEREGNSFLHLANLFGSQVPLEDRAGSGFKMYMCNRKHFDIMDNLRLAVWGGIVHGT